MANVFFDITMGGKVRLALALCLSVNASIHASAEQVSMHTVFTQVNGGFQMLAVGCRANNLQALR
jgi:hypothetical protein